MGKRYPRRTENVCRAAGLVATDERGFAVTVHYDKKTLRGPEVEALEKHLTAYIVALALDVKPDTSVAAAVLEHPTFGRDADENTTPCESADAPGPAETPAPATAATEGGAP